MLNLTAPALCIAYVAYLVSRFNFSLLVYRDIKHVRPVLFRVYTFKQLQLRSDWLKLASNRTYRFVRTTYEWVRRNRT